MAKCVETGCDKDGLLRIRGIEGEYCIPHYTDKVVFVGCALREMSRVRARRAEAEDNTKARQPAGY